MFPPSELQPETLNNLQQWRRNKVFHQFPALKETSQLFIVGSETKLFRNTFLKSETTEMIPESKVLVCSGCFSESYVWRRAPLVLVASCGSETPPAVSNLLLSLLVLANRTSWWSMKQQRLRNICCVSVQGLRPLKDPIFVVFEGESLRDLVNLVSRC